MVSLLDVNVLMALGWSNHEHHEATHAWLGSKQSWATCALTETAFVRLSSNPAVVGGVIAPRQAAIGLERMTAHSGHVFWEAAPNLSSLSCPAAWAQGHRQVTDSYLLALAEHHRGRFVTFDKRLAGAAPETAPIQLLDSWKHCSRGLCQAISKCPY